MKAWGKFKTLSLYLKIFYGFSENLEQKKQNQSKFHKNINEKLLWISFSLQFSFQNFELGPLSLTQTHTNTHTHARSSPDTFMCPTFYSGVWRTKTSFSLHFRFSKPLILSYHGKLCHCNPSKHINLCKHSAFLMIMRFKSKFPFVFSNFSPSF